MIAATIASLLTTFTGGAMAIWPLEYDRLDKELTLSSMLTLGDKKLFQSTEQNVRRQPVLTIELQDFMPWDEVVDQAWACLPPPGAHWVIRGSKGVIDNQVVIRRVDGFRCSRGFGSRPSAADVTVRQLKTVQVASDALANMGAGAVAARVRRIPIPEAILGDEAQKVSGGSSPAVEFRLGRILVEATVYGVANGSVGDQMAIDLARAVEFRIYASGLLGDQTREFRISNGRVLRGLTTGTGYVPLSEIRHLGSTTSDGEDSGGRWAQVSHANKVLRIDEYRERMTVNGNNASIPPPIPYKGDLWVPVRAVVEALGFTITG